jgi:hypothetical protein
MSLLLVKKALTLVTAAAALALPGPAQACACGCGVFDVGASSLFPSSSGGTAFVEFDALDQSRNWSGGSAAPAANNPDKDIRSQFYTAGVQYMIDRNWGVSVAVPIWNRSVSSDDGGGLIRVNHAALGDVRVTGRYTGFSADMSTGVIFGLKLPTGDYRYAGFDRDTEIGTGSTDAIVGVYHMGAVGKTPWRYFAEAQVQHPLATQAGYRPGDDANVAVGVYPASMSWGAAKVTPMIKVIGSTHSRDGGPEGDHDNTGYARVLAAPGVEVQVRDVRLYADVELPAYQQTNGNQLIAPVQLKLVLSREF